MNLKSITKSAAKLAVGAALTTGFAVTAQADWTLSSSTSITDGNWVLKVTVSGTELSVTGVTSVDDATTLDLSAAVTDGGATTYTIVSIGGIATTATKPVLATVILPETLRTIGKDAFSNCTVLKTVTPFLPAALTSLGMAAFYGCPIETPLVLSNPSLTSLPEIQVYGVFANCRFPTADLSRSGITMIGQYSFSGNTALTMLSLPETLTTIGKDAFSHCSALKTVTPFLPAALTSLGVAAFYGCPIETPLVLSNSSLTSIPEIGEYGVFKNSSFPSADMSRSGITAIGKSSFQGNTVLKDVKFPKTLTTIGSFVFWGDSSLLSVDFKSLPTFGDRPFYSTKGLPARFTYPAGDADWAAFIATSTESGALKLWKSADVTQAERDAYLAAFPATPKPVGKMSIGGSMKWLVPSSKVGMMLIFK